MSVVKWPLCPTTRKGRRGLSTKGGGVIGDVDDKCPAERNDK